MKKRSILAVFAAVLMLMTLPISSASGSDLFGGLDFGNIEITIDDVPLDEVIDAAAQLLTDSIRENVEGMVGELNDVLSEFAMSMSSDIEDMELFIKSLLNDSWYLEIPALDIDMDIRRSTCPTALELYEKQKNGSIEKEPQTAMFTYAGCGNDIVYVWDEAGWTEDLLEAAQNGSLEGAETVFGLPGETYIYEIFSVFTMTPSDEEDAACNMSNISDEESFDAFTDAVEKGEIFACGGKSVFGDELLTVVFWTPEDDSDWVAFAGRKGEKAESGNPEMSGAEVEYFSYSHSGSSKLEIYTYEVLPDGETGKMTVVYDLYCGAMEYILPADEEFLRGLSETIDSCGIAQWNGFGGIDPDVMDGSGFSVNVEFSDGVSVSAKGSNKFPEGFVEFSAEIQELFMGYLEKNGIDPDI